MLVHVELTAEFVTKAIHEALQKHMNIIFPETPIKEAVSFESDKLTVRTMLDFEAAEIGTLNEEKCPPEGTILKVEVKP